ncbi:unnamed protein product [Vicia faba]|uniref:Uncharacterized protein n=1 Tax=Vicia faba TaxID=3906 RepID=A0AAV1AYR9_VICFA|nr:unnamed protein product [Vicia faba]
MESKLQKYVDAYFESQRGGVYFWLYFKLSKKQISFLFPNLYISQMDFLKFVYVGYLVDEKAVAYVEPKSPAPIENTPNKGRAMEADEYGVPHPDNAIRKEIIH